MVEVDVAPPAIVSVVGIEFGMVFAVDLVALSLTRLRGHLNTGTRSLREGSTCGRLSRSTSRFTHRLSRVIGCG